LLVESSAIVDVNTVDDEADVFVVLEFNSIAESNTYVVRLNTS
jgi:hypothetical protein